MKVSNQFKILEGAQRFAVLRSVIDTIIKNSQNVLQAQYGFARLDSGGNLVWLNHIYNNAISTDEYFATDGLYIAEVRGREKVVRGNVVIQH